MPVDPGRLATPQAGPGLTTEVKRRTRTGQGGRRHADHVATTLLAALPHEIRGSLGVIALLADGVEDEEAGRAIAFETQRLNRLIDVIAEVAQVVSGTADLAVEAIDVAGLAASVLGAFRRDPDGADASVEVQGALPVAMGNAVLVERILLNLLSNAVRHGAPPIAVRARCKGDTVELAVLDAGPGMPRDWDSGPSAGARGQARQGSMGIGLSISRLFASEMGGELAVRSAPVGCTVSLRLPRAQS